jgi:exopolyphosphatase/guanosine-5'-triphosphate,3'-diphosphate pyrophosphatase
MTASGIVQRWEWRTFGVDLAPAVGYLAGLDPLGTQESDELYLLSLDGDTVKVRGGLMDIKILREIGAHGLERWEPVLKAPFPLGPDELGAVFAALRQPMPALARERYTVDELRHELVDPHPGVRSVPVHKQRVRYAVAGCIGELTDVRIGEYATRTIAIESADLDAVVTAVRAVGLGNRINTSYPRGMAALYDGEPPRYATIDVGTNSVKFHIGQPTNDGRWEALVDRAEVTQLGAGLAQTGNISTEAVERTAQAIRGMVAEARAHLVREIAAAGTAGLRMADNRAAVLEVVERHTGVAIEVVTGEEESRLAYVAALAGLGPAAGPGGPVVVFDTGGGSSQFTFGRGSTVDERFSVDVGAARYTEQFGLAGAVTRETLDAALAAISRDLGRLDDRPTPDALIGMGGAVTNLTAVSLGLARYDPDAVQGSILERSEVDRQIEHYRTHDAEQRRAIVGLQPQRAEVILAGACVVRTVMDKLGKDRLTVSDRGLRHGLAAERFGRGEPEWLGEPDAPPGTHPPGAAAR